MMFTSEQSCPTGTTRHLWELPPRRAVPYLVEPARLLTELVEEGQLRPACKVPKIKRVGLLEAV
jgi:hypothetical protein